MPIPYRVARYVLDGKGEEPKRVPPTQLVVVLDLLVHLPRIFDLLVEIESYDDEEDSI